MITGTVKWFNDEKGFGFVQHEGKDYFVHHKAINMAGRRRLEDGQKVMFRTENSPKGVCAVDVTPL